MWAFVFSSNFLKLLSTQFYYDQGHQGSRHYYFRLIYFRKIHIYFIFREAFHLFEFDIQEFEESLLLLGADDESNKLVHQLVIKLLQGCLPMYRKRITQEVCTLLVSKKW